MAMGHLERGEASRCCRDARLESMVNGEPAQGPRLLHAGRMAAGGLAGRVEKTSSTHALAASRSMLWRRRTAFAFQSDCAVALHAWHGDCGPALLASSASSQLPGPPETRGKAVVLLSAATLVRNPARSRLRRRLSAAVWPGDVRARRDGDGARRRASRHTEQQGRERDKARRLKPCLIPCARARAHAAPRVRPCLDLQTSAFCFVWR